MATMQCNTLAIVLGVLLLLSAGRTSALGINCRGSAYCSQLAKGNLSQMDTLVQGLPDDNVYTNGVHIACDLNICAFLQNIGSGSKTGAQIKGYVTDLVNHGCKICGSVPTEPGNNVKSGQLTVNYVTKP